MPGIGSIICEKGFKIEKNVRKENVLLHGKANDRLLSVRHFHREPQYGHLSSPCTLTK